MTVYIIRAGKDGPVKIGTTTKDVAHRMRALQYRSKEPLHILRTMEGSFDQERELHKLFHKNRLGGEWFTFHPEMLTCVVSKWRGLSGLKKMIAERGLFADWVAEQAGINPQTFSRMISGKRPVPDDKVPKLAKALRYSAQAVSEALAEIETI